MLSEKAKGKQRAIDLPDEGQSSEPAPLPSRDLVIRFTEGTPDLSVVVTEHDTLKDVKNMVSRILIHLRNDTRSCQIRRERPQLKTRRLRFIHSGRLLPDSTLLNAWLVALDGKLKQSSADDDSPLISATTWMHCSVGREIEDGEDEEGNEQVSMFL
jgi:hypothetical protein